MKNDYKDIRKKKKKKSRIGNSLNIFFVIYFRLIALYVIRYKNNILVMSARFVKVRRMRHLLDVAAGWKRKYNYYIRRNQPVHLSNSNSRAWVTERRKMAKTQRERGRRRRTERKREWRKVYRRPGMPSSLTLREIAVACCHCPARRRKVPDRRLLQITASI